MRRGRPILWSASNFDACSEENTSGFAGGGGESSEEGHHSFNSLLHPHISNLNQLKQKCAF